MIFHTKSICMQIKKNVDKISNQVILSSSNGFKLSGFAMQMQNKNANFYFAFNLIINFCNIYHCMGFVKIQTVMIIKHLVILLLKGKVSKCLIHICVLTFYVPNLFPILKLPKSLMLN